MKVGMLTSGGDCAGLNAVMRAIALNLYTNVKNVEIVGFRDGYAGLIRGEAVPMRRADFEGLLRVGGTVLGTTRTPFKLMSVPEADGSTRLAKMVAAYRRLGLDCLFTLGGAGTHRTAALLCAEGCNVIGLPKTIDNDIYGTDVTFGFHSAVDIATEAIDRIHTTANSHGRVMVVELMGNKSGWLTLNAGVAGGADAILLPEIPYDLQKVAKVMDQRAEKGKAFSIIAVAEGAMDLQEAKMKRKERLAARKAAGYSSVGAKLAAELEQLTGNETRLVLPGHIQRGGSPSAYDRVLSTQFGAYAARLIQQNVYGVGVAMVDGVVTHHPLKDIAGKSKLVQPDDPLVLCAKDLGIAFGD